MRPAGAGSWSSGLAPAGWWLIGARARLEAARTAGLGPIKLNAVVVRGLNDEEVPQLAALTLQYPWEMRFIEVMPLTGVAAVAEDGVVKSEELIAQRARGLFDGRRRIIPGRVANLTQALPGRSPCQTRAEEGPATE